MQTVYNVNRDRAQEGQTVGPRMAAPFTLPVLPQVTDVVIADGTPAAGETWTFAVTDDKSEQQYSVDFLSGVDLPTTLDNMVAALQLSPKLNDLFSYTEDGVDTLTATARNAGEPYTFAVTPGGSATATPSITQASGGTEAEVGLMFARAGAGEFRPLASGDTVADFAGILFRTDANHFQDFDEAPTAVASVDRGRTMSLMEEGRVWVLLEAGQSVTSLADGVHVRINNGRVGGFRSAADGGDTVDASAFCRWETLAGSGELALLRIHKQG